MDIILKYFPDLTETQRHSMHCVQLVVWQLLTRLAMNCSLILRRSVFVSLSVRVVVCLT